MTTVLFSPSDRTTGDSFPLTQVKNDGAKWRGGQK
jgi:hypothetical protein